MTEGRTTWLYDFKDITEIWYDRIDYKNFGYEKVQISTI